MNKQKSHTMFDISTRFIYSPTPDVNERLVSEQKTLKADVESLGKRLQYLETTFKNSQQHMETIFKSGGRA